MSIVHCFRDIHTFSPYVTLSSYTTVNITCHIATYDL